jgi:integrase
MSIELFFDSIKSDHTKRCYDYYLKKYGHDKLTARDPKIAESEIIDFILQMKKEGKSFYAISNYVTALISFFKINDIMLNPKRITRFLPERRRMKKDRSYTYEEIGKMLEIADERMRAVILILSCSGIRVGALPSIKMGNLENNGLTVYESFREEYLTFITPECKKAIDNYLDMRVRYGEKLTGDSLLIREQFDIRDPFQISKPKQISRDAIQWMLNDIARRSGVKSPDVPIAHGFRKFFTTQLINNKVNSEIREMLLGHNIGLASAYYRPTRDEMYFEYEKAIGALTINEENRLKKKIETLTIEKSRLDILEEKFKLIEQKANRYPN